MKNKLSNISLWICVITMAFFAFVYYPKFNKPNTEATLSWDANGYYAYLPAIFIYKDLKQCKFGDSIMQQYKPSLGTFAEGTWDSTLQVYKLRYSCGQALLMSPWFFVAHYYCTTTNQFPADGYSLPYQFCICIGMFLFSVLGIVYLRKILLQYFNDAIVAITLLIIVFGTNYLNYSSIDQAMTHSSLFTLYALLVHNVINYYKQQTTLRLCVIAFIIGLLTIIRPPELLSILIPILWGIKSIKDLQNRLLFFIKQYKQVLIAGLVLFLICGLQLVYGKFIAGTYIYNGYSGFTYHFLTPHIFDYCISARSGCFLYCPMLIIFFIALFIVIKKPKADYSLVVVIFLLINFYLVTAWEVWWYGARALVQSYVLFAFALAFILQYIHESKILLFIFYPFVLFFMYINIWATCQMHNGNIQIGDVSYAYYFNTLGTWHKPAGKGAYLLDNEDALIKHSSSKTQVLDTTCLSTAGNFYLASGIEFTPTLSIPNLNSKSKTLQVIATVKTNELETETWRMPQFFVNFYKGSEVYKRSAIRIGRDIQADTLQEVIVDAIIPQVQLDSIKVAFWNPGSNTQLEIRNVKAIVYN